jgi:hypothetical protein
LQQLAFARVDQDEGRLRGRNRDRHVTGILLMSGRVGHPVVAIANGKKRQGTSMVMSCSLRAS